jgi:predicted ATPase
MIHLKSITVREFSPQDRETFPFHLEIIRSLRGLEFDSPVTFLVGENGSGKSTVLEAIACAVESITVGSESVRTDNTLAPIRKLAQYFKLAWAKRTRKGFFLRAEDFFGYAKSMRQTREELEQDLRQVDREYAGRSSYAIDLARLPYQNELAALRNRYGKDLDEYSHGESFLTLFQARFVPDGLYLLDEPEAALSPTRQLSFIAAMKQMLQENAQFIVATHSPIILAFPDATILNLREGRIQRVQYEELEHVQLTKDFLNNPKRYLRYL